MIRKAIIKDLDRIMVILEKIIDEMHSYNNYQWDENYPQAKDFAADIEKGELYVSVRENMIVGFICINRVEPHEYEGLNWSSTKDALIIHRMGVDTDYRNAGIGKELVGFAEDLAHRSNVKYLKTDTNSLNAKAQALFQKCRYIFVGEMSFRGKEKPFYCYEKVLEG
ncbi:GNAT family N-acetyltransferase [Desulfitobacterium sp. AusDCA]|uniref:GNAT family N-acetyltransferase n=1 Tax=Desulfitobacterium sp. AusDCA TaxID=3240383 RepID=UPI003DA72DBF